MVGNRLFGRVFLANLAITMFLATTIGIFAAYQSRLWYLQRESSELESAVRQCAGALNGVSISRTTSLPAPPSRSAMS